jgi:hypothetical protein
MKLAAFVVVTVGALWMPFQMARVAPSFSKGPIRPLEFNVGRSSIQQSDMDCVGWLESSIPLISHRFSTIVVANHSPPYLRPLTEWQSVTSGDTRRYLAFGVRNLGFDCAVPLEDCTGLSSEDPRHRDARNRAAIGLSSITINVAAPFVGSAMIVQEVPLDTWNNDGLTSEKSAFVPLARITKPGETRACCLRGGGLWIVGDQMKSEYIGDPPTQVRTISLEAPRKLRVEIRPRPKGDVRAKWLFAVDHFPGLHVSGAVHKHWFSPLSGGVIESLPLVNPRGIRIGVHFWKTGAGDTHIARVVERLVDADELKEDVILRLEPENVQRLIKVAGAEGMTLSFEGG